MIQQKEKIPQPKKLNGTKTKHQNGFSLTGDRSPINPNANHHLQELLHKSVGYLYFLYRNRLIGWLDYKKHKSKLTNKDASFHDANIIFDEMPQADSIIDNNIISHSEKERVIRRLARELLTKYEQLTYKDQDEELKEMFRSHTIDINNYKYADLISATKSSTIKGNEDRKEVIDSKTSLSKTKGTYAKVRNQYTEYQNKKFSDNVEYEVKTYAMKKLKASPFSTRRILTKIFNKLKESKS